jgi:hypothetical protein
MDRNVDREYMHFKEGENCYAVSNAEELKELLDDVKNIDTTKVIQNARKILDRHIINAAENWNEEVPSLECEIYYARLFIVIITSDSECRDPTGIHILCCKQK